MARITVLAVHSDGTTRRWTLSERIVAEHLKSEHDTGQLLERLSWAIADAEALESQSADLDADLADDTLHIQLTTRSRGDNASERSGRPHVTSGRRVAT